MQGQYSGDPDCKPPNHSDHKVDIRIKNIFATHLICKVLLTQSNKYIVKVESSRTRIQVMVQDLHTMEVIIEWVLVHPVKSDSSAELPCVAVKFNDVASHILQAINTIN